MNFLNRQLQKQLGRMKRPHELSIPLRALTFAAQVMGIMASAYTTHLWLLGVITIIVLIGGHLNAYQAVRTQPIIWIRVAAFVMLHVALVWMFAGLFSSQPYPQAQFAMLVTAIISWELFSRLNLFSGFGLGLANLYVAATLSRDVVFGLFLLIYIVLLLAFLWVADSEDGTKRNPVILRPDPEKSARRTAFIGLSGLETWGPRFLIALILFGGLVFFFAPRYAGRPLIKPLSFRVPIENSPSSQIINPAVPLVQIEGWSDGESEY